MEPLIQRIILAGVVLAPSFAWGQSYREYYRRPEPEPLKHEISVGMRYLLAPDVDFGGLGNVGFGVLRTDNDGIVTYQYGNGRVSTDYAAGAIEGSNSGLAPIMDGQTGNFSYLKDDQRVYDADNNLIGVRFEQYASAALDDSTFAGDSSSSLGWEIAYTRYLNRKRTFGLVFGFSFNNFDSSFRDTIQTNLLVREYRHDLISGDLPVSGDNQTQAGYTGPLVRDPNDPTLITLDPSQRPTDPLNYTVREAQGKVRQDIELRSAIYSFRAGTTYNLHVGDKFFMNMGAGLSAVYYNADFTATEILELDGGLVPPTRGLTISRDSDWQIGPYVDASAAFQLNRTVNVFSGLQYQGGSNYEQANQERSASVKFNNQVYIRAGLGVRF